MTISGQMVELCSFGFVCEVFFSILSVSGKAVQSKID